MKIDKFNSVGRRNTNVITVVKILNLQKLNIKQVDS